MKKNEFIPSNQRGYIENNIFVTTKWLEKNLNDPNIRIVDTDSSEKYNISHIPGATNVIDNYYKTSLEDRVHIQNPDKFSETMCNLGIDNETLVIAYDRSAGLYSLRLLWALNYYGHTKIKILDGGYQKWLQEDKKITQTISEYSSSEFNTNIIDSYIAKRDYVKESIIDDDIQILDVRSDDEWTGKNKRGGPRGGHIPGAIHIEWTNFHTNGEIPALKTSKEIKSILTNSGFSFNKKTITYCQGGIRAAHPFWVLRLIGLELVKNYDGSWREWGSDFTCPISN